MGKLPAIQFYPGDWRKDPGIQSLDYESRGVWFEMLLMMHESDQRGRLTLNGKAMPEEALAQNLGIEQAKVKQTLSKLLSYGVASIEDSSGIIFSRRMVRDEELRQAKAAAGRKGGQSKPKQKPSKPQAEPQANGGSSVSSSVSVSKEGVQHPENGEAFKNFESDLSNGHPQSDPMLISSLVTKFTRQLAGGDSATKARAFLEAKLAGGMTFDQINSILDTAIKNGQNGEFLRDIFPRVSRQEKSLYGD